MTVGAPASLTPRYSFLHVSYWAGFCLVLSFSSVFLLARGLSNAQVGLVLAAGSGVSAVLQPVVGGVAGRSRVALRWWVAGFAALSGVVGLGLLVPGLGLLLTAVTFGVLVCTIQLVQPLINAAGMAALNAGHRIDFGLARALGSVAYAATSAGAGLLATASGPGTVAPLLVGSQALLFLGAVVFSVPDAAGAARASGRVESEATGSGAAPAASGPGLSRRQWTRFAVLVAGLSGCFFGHNVINNYIFQIVRHHLGTPADMGTAVLIGALVAVPPMLVFTRLMGRWRADVLLRVAAVVFTLKVLATWLAPNLAGLYLAQGLQVGGFALAIPASVYYANRLLPAREHVRGQAWMTLAATLGAVASGLVGGVLLDAAGVPMLLGVATAVSAVGTVAVLASTERV